MVIAEKKEHLTEPAGGHRPPPCGCRSHYTMKEKTLFGVLWGHFLFCSTAHLISEFISEFRAGVQNNDLDWFSSLMKSIWTKPKLGVLPPAHVYKAFLREERSKLIELLTSLQATEWAQHRITSTNLTHQLNIFRVLNLHRSLCVQEWGRSDEDEPRRDDRMNDSRVDNWWPDPSHPDSRPCWITFKRNY